MTVQSTQAISPCGICGESIKGCARNWTGSWVEQKLTNPAKDHSAIQCEHCGALICRKCEAKNKLWNIFSGYDKSICPKCSQPMNLKTIFVRENYDPKAVFLEDARSSLNSIFLLIVASIVIIVFIVMIGIFLGQSNVGVISLIGVVLFYFTFRFLTRGSGIGGLLKFAGSSSKDINKVQIKCPVCGENNLLNGLSFQFKCQKCDETNNIMLKDIKYRSQVLDSGLGCEKCQTLNPLGPRPAYFECSKCKEIITLEKVPLLQ